MNAVATKPRAKVAPPVYKRPEQEYVSNSGVPLAERLETLRAAFYEADEKLEAAYDAAEQGSAADTLLEHAARHLLCQAMRPILRNEDEADRIPTTADARRAHDALFPALAALEGVMALSLGTIIYGTLVEAFNLLDWAQNECEVLELERLLPAEEPEADFIRGRDHAIDMLHAADALTDEREGLRWQRAGEVQDNFFKGYLSEIIDDPTMLDGFTAIMSMTTRNDNMDLSELGQITLAETQAGAIGGDGTAPGPDAERVTAPPKAAPALGITDSFDDAQGHYLHALGLINALETPFQNGLVHAAGILMRKGDADMAAAVASRSADELNQVSADMSVLLEVLEAAADAIEMPRSSAIWGVRSIVELSKRELDARIVTIEAAEFGGAA